MTFKIDKNIPITDETRSSRKKKYPFEQMDVGDSFEVPLLKSTHRHIKSLIQSAFYQNGLKDKMKIALRNTTTGVRCWRIQ